MASDTMPEASPPVQVSARVDMSKRDAALRVALLLALYVALETIVSALTGEKKQFLYKEELHLSASAMAMWTVVLGIPTYLQPFLGAWADLKPLFGYHRRSYFLLVLRQGRIEAWCILRYPCSNIYSQGTHLCLPRNILSR